jgi:hypothetical protein
MESLFVEAGFEMEGMSESSVHPKYYELNGPSSETIAFGRVVLNGLNSEDIKDLFIPQYLMRARKAGSEFRRLERLVASSIESGNMNEAERVMRNIWSASCRTDALFMHAEVCCKLGLFDKSMERLERVLLFEPEREDALELKKRISMSTH